MAVLSQTQDSLSVKGFRLRQAQKGGNGNRGITGGENTGPSILHLQAVLPQIKLVNTLNEKRAQTPAVTFPYCSLCSRWAALMSAKLYVLISWPDGSRVINIENIKEPRKPFHLYTVGEQVLARCPGFSGLYWGVLEGISGK